MQTSQLEKQVSDMYNQFRTLLMNLPYADTPSEHIPPVYGKGLTLPSSLQDFYNLLYPIASSRFYKLFLTNNYLQLVNGTPYSDLITDLDSRVTYTNLDFQNYFKINRNSNPVSTNTAFPLFVFGNYQVTQNSVNLSDYIQVQQLSNTANISVTSLSTGTVYIPTVLLAFTDNLSQLVTIPTTGLSFQISGVNFTGNSNKQWTFYSETPYQFDMSSVYSKLYNNPGVVEAMLAYDRDNNNVYYENLWRQDPDLIYRMTGIILAYVSRVNNIWATLA